VKKDRGLQKVADKKDLTIEIVTRYIEELEEKKIHIKE